MNSKEILETFGISKTLGIVLFIQSIIVIIGCFLAIQDIYFRIIGGYPIIFDLIILLLFICLIYYSFIGFRKSEKYFKRGIVFFIISLFCGLITTIGNIILYGDYHYTTLICIIIILILSCYFAYNLDNYDKAKKIIILIIPVDILIQILIVIINGIPLEFAMFRVIYIIPSVSVALTYIARYDKGGFKELNK